MAANNKNVPNIELQNKIKEYINNYYIEHNQAPTVREIASKLSVGSTTVQRYLKRLKECGEIDLNGNRRGIRTSLTDKISDSNMMVGLIGSVSCGALTFAEQNVIEYFKLPSSLIGKGEFFMLQACGDSMINAGINNGDYVIIRKQNTADNGQIVVALVDDETTLKRFYIDNKNKKIVLHPENDNYEDIVVNDVLIQGIAVSSFKKIE